MKSPSLVNFKGYSSPDPLDKAPGIMNFILPMVVNFILSVSLLYLITSYKVLYFNGFSMFGCNFSPICTMGLEVFITCFIFTPIINYLRKSSSLISYLVVFIPFYLLDLYVDAHYRNVGNDAHALWVYYDSFILFKLKIHVLIFFLTISVDGFVFGILSLYIARLLAQVLYAKRTLPNTPTNQQYGNLFRKEWSDENVAKPERDWAFYILRILGFIYLIYLGILILGKLGASPWPASIQTLITMTYANPALAINTYFKITLMIMLAFLAAYNKSLRFYACIALLTGHLISTVYSLIFHYVTSLGATDSAFLIVSAEADGLMVVIFLIILLTFKKDAKIFAPEKDFPIDFSVPMTLLKIMYTVLTILFLGITLSIVCIRLFGSGYSGISAVFGSPDPMIGNTVTLYSTLTIIAFFLIKRERLRQYFFNTLIVPIVFGSCVALVWFIFGSMRHEVLFQTRYNTWVQVNWYFVLHGVAGILIVSIMVAFRKMYYNVDYALNTVSPSAAIDIMALVNAFYDCDTKQQSSVLHLIDQYAGGIRGRKRGILTFPFGLFENVMNFIFGLRPAFSTMNRDEQRYYLRKYFLTNELEQNQACVPLLASAAAMIGGILNSTVMFANYSYINERNKIGYVPPDARDRLQGEDAAYNPPYKEIPPLPRDPLDKNNFKPDTPAGFKLVAPHVTTIVKEADIPDEIDYMIIGSGPGGATAAYRLACAGKGDSVLMVESGYRYQPLQDFSDGEIEMMKKVYKEGGAQLTKGFNMILAQGECVGGGSVVNNAVCFQIPDPIKAKWANEYGIDITALNLEYNQVQSDINITELGSKGINQVVKNKFVDAVNKYNSTLTPAEKLVQETAQVNHLNNNGDGNWNIGNKRMRKRSMLETYIPWSEARGVRVISNMTAVRFTSSNNKKADAVILWADNGMLKKVKVNKAVIVAGGVIASSHFLMRSEVTNPNVGLNVSCNFAFPIALDYNEEIRAFDGEQITLAALDPQQRAAFETYFNPPSAFALSSMPFSFNKRTELMQRYKYMLNFGCLVGSEPNGVALKKADILNGQSFTWQFGETDIANIKYAFNTMIKLGQISGSTRVILPSKPGIEFELTDKNIEQFTKSFNDFPLRITDIQTYTAHPQGGNLLAASQSPNKKKRVLTEDFLVDGYSNVFVADASTFPTSITVNPQWTIMAMSSLAAKSVLKHCS